jgi:hypothetical protein
VGVPWSSLWLIPLALVASRGVQLVAFGFETSLAASLTGAFVGLVLALCLWVWAWLKWVPLVRV